MARLGARVRAACALGAVAALAASGAIAQGRSGADASADSAGRAKPVPERPTKPPTAETEAWLSKSVQVGDGWRVVHKDAEGVVLAKTAGAVRNDGVVPMHLRIEFMNPKSLARHEIRSVQADLNFDCAFSPESQTTGSVTGFEGQNLTGRKYGLEGMDMNVSGPGKAVETQNPRVEGLKLVNMEVMRQQCAEGHQAVAARYAGWRPLLSDEKGVRLVQGDDSVGLDRKLDLKFRIEAKDSQSTPEFKWRSAIANVSIDCVEGAFTADTTLYAGQDETGASAKLAFDGYPSMSGVIQTRAPGAAMPAPVPPKAGQAGGGGFAAVDTGPGKTVVELLRKGAMVTAECDAAKAKLATALAKPGDPLRRQAESWAASTLNTKGFRLPTYVPDGVLMLSDEVVASGSARRALVRGEFLRPVPTRDGKMMASRITVLEVDCAGKKVRGVSESTFARNGARDLIRETPAPGAPWAPFADAPAFEGYFDAICTTKLAG